MPETIVYFYKDSDGRVPVLDWLKEIRRKDRRAYALCNKAIGLLEMLGHELRRPRADYLREGIYELRVRCGNVQYRLLYFFDGKEAVVLAHGLTKEKTVPPADIERAIARKQIYKQNPQDHQADEHDQDD